MTERKTIAVEIQETVTYLVNVSVPADWDEDRYNRVLQLDIDSSALDDLAHDHTDDRTLDVMGETTDPADVDIEAVMGTATMSDGMGV